MAVRVRKTRVDTATGMASALSKEAKSVRIPHGVSVTEEEMVFFHRIVAQKPVEEWTDSQIISAVHMARCECDIERLSKQIKEEGDICLTEKGWPYENPKHKILRAHFSMRTILMRSLQLHAHGVSGKTRDVVKRRQHIQLAQQAIDDTEDDLLDGRIH